MKKIFIFSTYILLFNSCTWNNSIINSLSIEFQIPDHNIFVQNESQSFRPCNGFREELQLLDQYYFINDKNGEVLFFDTAIDNQLIIYESLEVQDVSISLFYRFDYYGYNKFVIRTFQQLPSGEYGIYNSNTENHTTYGEGKKVSVTNLPNCWLFTSNKFENVDYSYANEVFEGVLQNNHLPHLLMMSYGQQYLWKENIDNLPIDTSFDLTTFPTMNTQILTFEDSVKSGNVQVFGKMDNKRYMISKNHISEDTDLSIGVLDFFDRYDIHFSGSTPTHTWGHYDVHYHNFTALPTKITRPILFYDTDSYVSNGRKVKTYGTFDSFTARYRSENEYEDYIHWYIEGPSNEEIDLNINIRLPIELTSKYEILDTLVARIVFDTLEIKEYEAFSSYQQYLNFFLNPREQRDIEEVSKYNITFKNW